MVSIPNFQLNKYQSSIDDLNLSQYPDEIVEQFVDFMTRVPYIKNLTNINRKRAKDLPRDEKGRIIIDLTNPHILEDMDYFRPTAIHYMKTGRCTDLRPNPNKKSEFRKWFDEEIRRCNEGYVRKSDGEWVTGDFYFFLNYCPIMITKQIKGRMAERVWGFPDVWEGHYLKFHYIAKARENGKHGAEMASRSKGKSYSMAAIAAKRFLLGQSESAHDNVQTFIASYIKEYLNNDGILNKFESYIDFCRDNTEFPCLRLKDSLNDMVWISGYKDKSGAKRGSKNQVIGISVKESPGKLRGKRGAFIGLEEMGSFPNLIELYGTLRPSMEEGEWSFGMIYAQGTAGDKDSDFSAAQKIMYSPRAFNMEPIENVYDIPGQGAKEFVYFFAAYMNRKGCYNKDGVSDVTKALLEVLVNRYNVKYNTNDLTLITRTIAEHPIVPQEAIMKTRGNIFPVNQLNQRVHELDSDEHAYDDVWVGFLTQNKNGKVEFKITADQPIREYPIDSNKETGAIEIFSMPEKDGNGNVYPRRYIMGHDPVDNDIADSKSLTSTFVLDTWTDRIAAEYTGRQQFADDNFEIVRKLCLFYNAICCYENNKKGLFAYFQRMNCLHLLADTPQYLRDRNLVKSESFGNTAKGVNATAGINAFADERIRDWLLQPVKITSRQGDEEVETTVPNLSFIKNRALLQELASYNTIANFDRVRALGMVMIYREEQMIKYRGDMNRSGKDENKGYLGNDEFFEKNYRQDINELDNFSKNQPKIYEEVIELPGRLF